LRKKKEKKTKKIEKMLFAVLNNVKGGILLSACHELYSNFQKKYVRRPKKGLWLS